MRCIFSITRHQPRHPFSTLCCNFSITRDEPRHPLCRSVEAPTASQHVAACRSVDPASQRRSANSVAASLPRRSVAAPTALQRRSRVAASLPRRSITAWQRQQRRSVAPASQRRSVAASQRHPPPRASQRRSVAVPPAPWSVTAQRRKPTFRPPLPLHCAIKIFNIPTINATFFSFSRCFPPVVRFLVYSVALPQLRLTFMPG